MADIKANHESIQNTSTALKENAEALEEIIEDYLAKGEALLGTWEQLGRSCFSEVYENMLKMARKSSDMIRRESELVAKADSVFVEADASRARDM